MQCSKRINLQSDDHQLRLGFELETSWFRAVNGSSRPKWPSQLLCSTQGGVYVKGILDNRDNEAGDGAAYALIKWNSEGRDRASHGEMRSECSFSSSPTVTQ